MADRDEKSGEWHYHLISHISTTHFNILKKLVEDTSFRIGLVVECDNVSQEEATDALKTIILNLLCVVEVTISEGESLH